MSFNLNMLTASQEASSFQLAELIVYGRAVPDAERQAIEGYMVRFRCTGCMLCVFPLLLTTAIT